MGTLLVMPLLHPASLQAEDLRGVWVIFFWTACFVAVFVYALIFYSLFRWRARGQTGMPPQFKQNPPLEIIGVLIPLAMVCGLFYITFVREVSNDTVHPNPYATVDVKAYDWSWTFSYPGHNVVIAGTPFAPPELVLPAGKITQINLYSADVDHSFWVPAFLFKRDALPGVTNHFDLTPNQVGVFRGVCSEFCGLDHAQMTFTVRVIPSAAFDRWLATGRRIGVIPRNEEPRGAARRGAEL
ncbi:MAG TPA: cytochrome c oxidase subunit II [Candidatus Rubrimentiphilum sp.]|nr:cytochrome c oxidase subunit II [Candidatus Rubrimentiphilum sp.]